MKKFILPFLVALMSLLSQPVFSQEEKIDTAALGLAGDNLDLYAVLELFQKSKTIEAFEKSLNEQKTGINNMDLDLDKKVDFIKVVTKQKDSSFSFILQIAVSEKETQDVAVILVDKKDGKVLIQIVGDPALYGKDYVVEPKSNAASASTTANPAYKGPDPVTINIPAPPTPPTIVIQPPIVEYVYSPAYVPYYPPYYYGFYPPYFAAFTVMAVGIYRHNNYHYHGGGYGYHNTTVIHNHNNYNNYNGNRNTSDRVSHHNASGNYGDGRGAANRNNASTRPATNDRPGGANASTRPSTNDRPGGANASTRPSTNDRPGGAGGASASTRPSTNDRPSGGASASTRPSTSDRSSGGSSMSSSRPSTSNSSMNSGRTRSSGGGGYSGGGGGGRGGGGGGGRRR